MHLTELPTTNDTATTNTEGICVILLIKCTYLHTYLIIYTAFYCYSLATYVYYSYLLCNYMLYGCIVMNGIQGADLR